MVLFKRFSDTVIPPYKIMKNRLHIHTAIARYFVLYCYYNLQTHNHATRFSDSENPTKKKIFMISMLIGIHILLCLSNFLPSDFCSQHPVDFLLHRLSCVLTVMESDNIGCLPDSFCKCIVFNFWIHFFPCFHISPFQPTS